MLNAFARELQTTPSPRTDRPMTAARIARQMSAISSFYTFARKLGLVDVNPATDAGRPTVDRHHTVTVGRSIDEAAVVIHATDVDIRSGGSGSCPKPNRC
jgi:site-specific recombinase XerD